MKMQGSWVGKFLLVVLSCIHLVLGDCYTRQNQHLLNNHALVVDVVTAGMSSTNSLESDWLSFEDSIQSDMEAGIHAIILASVDSSCRVEVKLDYLSSDAGFIVLPSGRGNPSWSSSMGLVNQTDSADCDFASAQTVHFGRSVISSGPELAFVFDSTVEETEVVIGILYRQRCDQSSSATGGFELPAATEFVQDLTLKPQRFASSVAARWLSMYSWSIRPHSSLCGVQFTVTKSSWAMDFTVNGFDPIVRVTYKSSQGMELVFQVRNFAAEDSALEVSYQAVECGTTVLVESSPAFPQLVSWNAVVKPLLPASSQTFSSWTSVEDTSRLGMGSQTASVYYVPHDPQAFPYVIRSIEIDNGDWGELPDSHSWLLQEALLYVSHPSSMPLIFYSLQGSVSPVRFKYRYLLDSVPEATIVRRSEWESIHVNEETLTATRMLFRAETHTCMVELRFSGEKQPKELIYHPYGFDLSQVTDFEKVELLDEWSLTVNTIAQSVGRDIGITFRDFLMKGNPLRIIIDIRQICPKTIRVTPPPARKRSSFMRWRPLYITDHASNSAYSFISPRPSQNSRCKVEVAGNSPRMEWLRQYNTDLMATCISNKQGKILANQILVNREAVQLHCPLGRLIIQPLARPIEVLNAALTAHSIRKAQFAFRVRCRGSPRGDLLPPFPTVGTFLKANRKWQVVRIPPPRLTIPEYERIDEGSIEGNETTTAQVAWTIAASNLECQVELKMREVNVKWLVVFEDFMHDEGYAEEEDYWKGFSEGDDYYGDYLLFKEMTYVSCGHRVLLWDSLNDGITNVVREIKYRQRCSSKTSSSSSSSSSSKAIALARLKRGRKCVQDRVVVPKLNKWKRLIALAPSNLNQQRHTDYFIEYPPEGGSDDGDGGRSNPVLELEFISIIAESWVGQEAGPQSLPKGETHVVRIDGSIPAIIGKQYFFKRSIRLSMTHPVISVKKGQMLFTVRYRLVNTERALKERDIGQVLIASDKPKILQFSIPKQFSTQRAAEMMRTQFVSRPNKEEYEEYENGTTSDHQFLSGWFPVWLYKHHYTIRPKNPSCQVVLEFTKMDIGSGFLVPTFRRSQHRLAVVVDNASSFPISLASKRCSTALDDQQAMIHCATLNTQYVSTKNKVASKDSPSSSLLVLFRSGQFREEYEYEGNGEYDDSLLGGFGSWEYDNLLEGEYLPDSGDETTWGSGWTAVYHQKCVLSDGGHSAVLPLVPVIPVPAILTASTLLPSFPLPSIQPRLFLDMRWIIYPSRENCSIEYQVIRNTTRSPVVLVQQQHSWIQSPLVVYEDEHLVQVTDRKGSFQSPPRIASKVLVRLMGTDPAQLFHVQYRQICTVAQTHSPSASVVVSPQQSADSTGGR